jgi:hypothetical protein
MNLRSRPVLHPALWPTVLLGIGCGTAGPGASSPGSETQAGVQSEGDAASGEDEYQDAFTGPGDEAGQVDIPNPYAPEVIDTELCELDWPMSADVSGTTPAGDYNARWAWFGWLTCAGEGLSPTLVLLDDPTALADAVALQPTGDALPYPSMEWYLFGACSPNDGWVGEGNVTFYLRDESEWHQAQGWVTIESSHRIFEDLDPNDPPRMRGTIRVQDGDQWNVEGTFEAAYCGPLSYDLGCD